MSNQQYLFIGYTASAVDYKIADSRIEVYDLIEKYSSFELYTIGERCNTAQWRKYWDDYKLEIVNLKELAEYQRLKAKFEGK